MGKIVTFGELMLRLSSPGHQRLADANQFDVCYGGGEANVAVSLSHYGHDAYFVSSLPNNDLGDAAIKALLCESVKTNYINRSGQRIGIYYLESGASLRASKVIYDRKYSSFSESALDDYDWNDIFKGASIFHFSGITPALSDNCAKLTLLACQKAKELGVLVSCDLNYRKNLWNKEKARSVMIPLMEYVDILIGNEEDAEACLGYKPDSDITNGETSFDGYKNIFQKMFNDFHLKYVASTLRESFSASHNGWKALLFDGYDFYESKRYDINPIVDRVGAGDSFSGGLLHGLLTFNDLAKSLEFAVAASALKHTIPGDFNKVKEEEVIKLMNGDASGRVAR